MIINLGLVYILVLLWLMIGFLLDKVGFGLANRLKGIKF